MFLEASTAARGTETDHTASRTEDPKAGDRRTGAGREADTTREIGNETGSVTETVIERETGIVAETEIERTRKIRCPAINSNMSLS